VFTGDVAGNLIHRDVLVALDDKPTFVAKRDQGEKTREFLASTDSWFRPASFIVGPDGFLYVVDMYRQHIETPLSIPEDLKADMDFLNGSDRGRIYRIIPEGTDKAGITKPKLNNLSSAEIVRLLVHPNRWWRLQAQRLLLQKKDLSVISQIKALTENEDARVRLHALYVLEGMNELNASLVGNALKDPHPGVREHGIILSEGYPELLPQLLDRINDTSIRVVFQAALSAGEFTNQKALDALAKVVAFHGEDPWFRTAVLSAKSGPTVAVLERLISQYSFMSASTPWKTSFIEDLSFAIGSADQMNEINSLLDILSSASMQKESTWQLAGLSGLKKGLQKSSASHPSRKEKLETIQTNTPEQIKDAIHELRSLYVKRTSL
jgi:hypothetical protein